MARLPRLPMTPSPWLMRFVPRPAAAARLVCFSFAGGGAAAYRPFALGLPGEIEVLAVQLPGRESRLREKPLTSFAALLEGLVPALQPLLDRPYALFGHSMGAMLAYETARAIVARGLRAPSHLVVSGRRAPQLPETATSLAHLDDEAFVEAIGRRYGGIPSEVLQHPEILELLLPTLRADMCAIEQHRHAEGAPLECPITACGGRDDAHANRAQLEAWSAQTVAGLEVLQFPGSHFYFNDAAVRARLLADLGRTLAPLRLQGVGSIP